MELGDALGAAIEACAGWVDPAPLRHAQTLLAAPWRVAVVGRVAAGKSTLINARWPGAKRPTGLGGVTRAVAEVEADDVVLVDTPGIDDPDQAVILLQPLMDQVDAVVWVVDGLQPATASERDVLAHTLVAETPLEVVVSKVDLIDEAEVAAVVNRVRTLAVGWSPLAVVPHNLRLAASSGTGEVGTLAQPRRPGTRRLMAISRAVDTVRAALAPLHRPPNLDGLLEAWTQAIRGVVAAVEGEIEQGRIQHKTDALAALGAHTHKVGAVIQGVLGPAAPPRLPRPEAPSVTTMNQVLGSLSGREGALRVLRAGAARWMAEGQVTLREWWADQEALQQRSQTRQRLEERLEAVGAAI